MKISSGQDSYDILFSNTIEDVGRGLQDWFLLHPSCKKIFVVSDCHVAEVQKHKIKYLRDSLRDVGLDVNIKIIESGELSKSLEAAEIIWSQLAELEFTRGDVLIALGGGVIGDLTGFCASTYMRGIDFIQIPTTLLAQIDSSIGGKVAINLPQGKNLVGAFHNPALVIMHSQFLETLEAEILSDGIGELIKYAYLGHLEILDTLEYLSNLNGFKCAADANDPLMIEMMLLSLRIKKTLIENDFKETGVRRYLNLGHTIGHAIEKGAHYQYSHGHCVANGCLWVLRLTGNEQGYLRLKNIMLAYRIPILDELKISDLMIFLKRDKKSESGGVHFILPNGGESCTIGLKDGNQLEQILSYYEGNRSLSDERFLAAIQESAQIQWMPFDELEEQLRVIENKSVIENK